MRGKEPEGMLIFENVRLALFSLRANKMRALLTMLGIIIGITSVIAIMTVGNSMSKTIENEMAGFGANNLNVMLTQKEEEGVWDTQVKLPTESDYITKEMVEAYCSQYNNQIIAIAASDTVGVGAQATNHDLHANVNIMGVSVGYFVSDGTVMLAGHIFTVPEIEKQSMVAIISDKAVENLFDGKMEEAIGSSIEVKVEEKYYHFTVVGVYQYEQSLEDVSAAAAERNIATSMYIPLVTAQKIKHVSGYTGFTVMVTPETDANLFSDITCDFLNQYYVNNKDFEVYAFSLSSMVESASNMVTAVSIGISIIAGIALLVGGIGVMNIMLVSVTERTKEIGIRKALGAPNGYIRIQFIMESMMICLIGGLIGIVLGILSGYGAVSIMESIMGTEMFASVSLQSILISLVFSTAIGLFFGYYPANKAAKLDPIEALRYE